MTLEELKQKIDAYIGLESTVKPKYTDSVELIYTSSTGVCLFSLTVSDFGEDEWQFDGYSSTLLDSWEILCNIHKEQK